MKETNNLLRYAPWRVVYKGCWHIWTRYDKATGSRNNYVIADGIQSEAEALAMAACPELIAACELALATIERLKPAMPFDSTQATRDVIDAALEKALGIAR